jgi:hypothetical protein
MKLAADTHSVWRDVSIRPGEEWAATIDHAITQARALILIMSPKAGKAEFVTYEWSYAMGAGVPVIPLLLEGTTLHPRLAALQFLDFTNPQRPWERLSARLREIHDASIRAVPPIKQLHGYSGEWRINTTFRVWQGQPVADQNKVVFQGAMVLMLAEGGRTGSGTQIGTLSVSLDGWRARYQVANKVLGANVSKEGALRVTCQVLSRKRLTPDQPPEPYNDELFGDAHFTVHLRPVPGNPQRLTGDHTYVAGTDHQKAEEVYDYVGFASVSPT